MKKIKILRAYIKPLAYLLFIAVIWITLAPRQIGGQYLYIIVSGNSMQPFLDNGDLAVLHSVESYQIGDVVLYRHPDLGPVIHRIISIDGDKYIVKGDNNNWVDSYTPSRSEISSKLWFHVHYAGRVIEQFRTPVGAALLAGVLGIFVLWPVFEKPGRDSTLSA